VTKYEISLKDRRTFELNYEWSLESTENDSLELLVAPEAGSYKLTVRLTLEDGRHIVRDLLLRVV
jgi:hypothetical protein